MTVVTIGTPEQMAALGARIAPELRAGDVIALDGELGAGKTTFTRGLGEALGVRGAVTSPTFVIARTHLRQRDAPPLVHVDAYRLGGAAELDDLDIDFAHSIVVVEWAGDLVERLADSVLSIEIVRPTGAAASDAVWLPDGEDSEDSADSAGSADSADSADGNDDADEPIESRTVTIRPHGTGWVARAARLDAIVRASIDGPF